MFHVEHFEIEESRVLLIDGLKELNLTLPDENIESLLLYFKLLLAKNVQVNLISKKGDIKSRIASHLLDSLTPLLWSGWPNTSLAALDIGSGGGLPAIPLSIVFPKWKYSLAESTTKKANFLNEIKETMQLSGLTIINKFLTPGKNDGKFYDIITARALSSLKELVPLVGPKLNSGGYFVAFKGPRGPEEIIEASSKLEKNKLLLTDELSFTLPYIDVQRRLYLFTKQ